MAIKRFADYETTKGYTDRVELPKGGYVIEIKKAEAKENSKGQYIEILFDIVEGEYKGFYEKDYRSQTSEDKKWRGKTFLNVPLDDGSVQDGWTKRAFRTFTDALEASNPGYHFDWDETKFKGKIVGGLFRAEERLYNGEVYTNIKIGSYTSVEKVRSGQYKLPKDKTVKRPGQASGGSINDFVSVPDTSEEELPF